MFSSIKIMDKKNKQKKEDSQSTKRVIQNNLFILSYVKKYTPFYLVYTCISSVLHIVEIFAEHTLGIKFITDAIQYGRPFQEVLHFLICLSGFIVFVFVTSSILNNYIQPKAKEKLYRSIRAELFEKAVNTDLSCYDDPEYYTDFVWSINEVSKRVDETISYLTRLIEGITVIFTTGAFFIAINSVGLIFVLTSFLLTFVTSMILNKLKYRMDVELKPKQRKRDYINRVFYLTDYAKEIRLSNVAKKLKKDFMKSNSDIIEAVDRHTKKQVLYGFLNDYVFSSFILDGLYILYLVFIAVRKVISYGSAIALFHASGNFRRNLQNLTGMIPLFQQNSMYIERIRAFMNYQRKVRDSHEAGAVPQEPCSLELKNVFFGYSKNSDFILKDISLTINPGEKVAFVGYNGAGKTTLTKLLMRLYDVTEGEILLDGRNIKEYRLKDYRSHFGSVFQDYQLFAASIAENVRMDNYIDVSKSHIIGALDESGFTGRLKSLKEGIHTLLTREFDDSGVNLSGGEAQKVAIARVFAKACSIIILDEPSSALDPISEYHLNEAVTNAVGDKTVVFISHRLSTTRMADRIYMLEGGRIIEQGSHDELISHGGKYAEMFNLQAEKYRFSI